MVVKKWLTGLLILGVSITGLSFNKVTSKIIKLGQKPEVISADITGVKKIYLIVNDAGDGNKGDFGVWGNPVVIDKKGKKTPLSKLKRFVEICHNGKIETNRAPRKTPLTIGKKKFKSGFYTPANSVLGFEVNGKYKTFQSEIGIQNSKKSKNASCIFSIDDKYKAVKPEIIPSITAVELAIKDLTRRWRSKYPNGKKYLSELNKIKSMKDGDEKVAKLVALQRKALLENPLLRSFDKILAVRREYGGKARKVGNPCTPGNAYSLESVNVRGGKDELITLSGFTRNAKTTPLFKPELGGHVAEVDLHFSGQKIMYSGLGKDGNWHLHEVDSKGKYLRQITPSGVPYNSFDSCYLPNGKIIYTSTAPMQGLPCESGRIRMSNTYLIDPQTKAIRRLTFDQDANWGPTVMEDGKVMFLRWEYSDLPHFFSRTMMTMNPDGSAQKMHYGSNSFWPNTMSNAKVIPGASSKFIAVISGHHTDRPGPLCIFDVNEGRFEADGALQLIPGYNKKVVPEIKDYLYSGFYPKFLSPIPLGTKPSNGAGKYFLVSCKPTKSSLWGIYLVDIYDNIVKIAEEEGYALNEPIPFVKTKRAPVIPEQVNLKSKSANVYIANIYEGPGLKNVPKGTVKALRLFTYHFSYYKSGSHEAVGCEASWDVKRILGTVPVNSDGSVSFKVPANIPIAIQPIDQNGAALQIMRSWITPMPGETVACLGCHEDPNMAPATNFRSIASQSAPVNIRPWLGEERNFSFLREVQPVLNKRCVSCHNPKTEHKTFNGSKIPDFQTLDLQPLVYQDKYKDRGDAKGGPFSVSYNNLNPYVRRPGPESDFHLFNPMEFHTSTAPLFQILERGHHGVTLTATEKQRLAAWIDFNVPFWGSWSDTHRDWANHMHRRWSGSGKENADQLNLIKKYQDIRNKLQKQYANITVDYESDQYPLNRAKAELAKIKPVTPKAISVQKSLKVAGWPTKVKQGTRKEVSIGGKKVAFRQIPTGKFVMGSTKYGTAKTASITSSFWMAEKEVTNELFLMFKKDHDSGFIDEHGKDHTRPGIECKTPSLPVIRVSWLEATAFTKWLSKKTGKKFRLPTEKEWEYAARAGSDKPFFWGNEKSDFSKYANFADKNIDKFDARQTFNFILREDKFNDGAQIQTTPGKYQPNNFGLYDMFGNVAEFTSTSTKDGRVVTKGGSWYDLPHWVDAGNNVKYEKFQRVYNVGIRLIME